MGGWNNKRTTDNYREPGLEEIKQKTGRNEGED